LRRTFQSNLRSINVKVSLQGSLRRFERVVNEAIELDVLQVGTRLAAYEIEILAIALAAIAEPQSRAALKDDVLENTSFG
jgi:hypothetical protein